MKCIRFKAGVRVTNGTSLTVILSEAKDLSLRDSSAFGLRMTKSKHKEAPLLPAPDQTRMVVSTPTSVPVPASAKTSVLASAQEMLPSADSETGIPDAILDSRIRDLLVLEWLGEADGLLEDFNPVPIEAPIARTI